MDTSTGRTHNPLQGIPKVVPWFAAQSYVDQTTAEALWREASFASASEHEGGSHEQISRALVLFQAALAREAGLRSVWVNARAWRKLQRRLARRVLEFIENLIRVAHREIPLNQLR